jgi:hypothetical protein
MFLQHLGSCLTAFEVHTDDDWNLSEQLIRVTATHLNHLRHLALLVRNGSHPDAAVIDQLVNSPAAQMLETLKLSFVFPDMQSFAKVLALPKLWLFEEATLPEPRRWYPEAVDEQMDEDLSQIQMSWPTGKPPMQLSLFRASVSHLAALPLQHFNRISLEHLSLSRRMSRQQREAALQHLMSAVQRCPDLELSIQMLQTHPGDGREAGLSVLGSGCPIQIGDGSLAFMRVDLDESDMRGLSAAWGSQVKIISFFDCTLTPGAWAAINPTNFPALGMIDIRCCTEVFVPYLTALCMAWPPERKLFLSLKHLEDGAEVMAAHVPRVLQAHGRHNIVVEMDINTLA